MASVCSGTVDAVPYPEVATAGRVQDGIRDQSNWIPSLPTVRCKRSRPVSYDRAIDCRRGRHRVRDIIVSHRLQEGGVKDSLTSACETVILKRRQRFASYSSWDSPRPRQRPRATFDVKDHHRTSPIPRIGRIVAIGSNHQSTGRGNSLTRF